MEERSFGGSQPLEELGEEGVEYAPSEENDISYQLGEKIRSQAQRLAKLEQYRLLCENRILELAPDHPLPVLPEHLGQTYDDSAQTELHQAYQKISRLEQQLSRSHPTVPLSEFHSFPPPSTPLSHGQLQELYSALYSKAQALISEKEDLEESLRTEVLQTEEQRAYIEALKQALETKMEELGFRAGGVDAFADLTHVRTQLEQLRRDQSRHSSTESSVLSLQQQLSQKTKEAADAQAHSEVISKELDEVTAALQQGVEELSKLEEEKSALLDYVQERAEVEKGLKDEIRRLENEAKSDRAKAEKTAKQLELAENQLKGLKSTHEEALSDRDQAHSSLESQLESSLSRLQSAESHIKSFEKQIQSLTEQLKSASLKNQQLQANNSTLSNTLQETQTELDAVKAVHTSVTQEGKGEKEALLVANTKVRELNEQCRSLGSDVKIYEERVAAYDELIERMNRDSQERAEGLYEKQETILRENITLKQKIRELEAELSAQKDDFKLRAGSLQRENDDLKVALETIQAQIEAVTNDKEALEAKLLEPRESDSIRSLQNEVKRLNQTLSAAQRRVDSLNEENLALQGQVTQAEADCRAVSSQLRDREKKLSETISANEALKSNLDSVQADLERISSDTQAMADEAFQTRQRANDTLQHHNEELKTLRKVVSQSGNVVAVFAGNLGAVSGTTTEYTAVLSEGFRDGVGKWGQWVEGDSVATAESLVEWVRMSSEELEALVRRVLDLKSDLSSFTDHQSLYEQRLHELDSLERELKSKETSFSREMDGLVEINQSLKRENELAYQRIESLTADNVKSRREVQSLSDELNRAREQVAIYSVDTLKWKQTGDQELPTQKGLEEKVALLVREKKELELLLARLQTAVPSNALQRVFLEMIKARGELEVSQREYIRLENLLLTKEGEMRVQTRTGDKQQATELRREVESLRQQLGHSEAQVSVYKRQMTQLEGELQDAERVERRRFALQEESERNVVLLQEQLFRRNKESTLSSALPQSSLPRDDPKLTLRDEFASDIVREESQVSPQSCQSIESRLGRLAARENRPRLTLQDKLSQAKVELSLLKRRPQV